jgi:hypothetical protein
MPLPLLPWLFTVSLPRMTESLETAFTSTPSPEKTDITGVHLGAAIINMASYGFGSTHQPISRRIEHNHFASSVGPHNCLAEGPARGDATASIAIIPESGYKRALNLGY